MIKMWKYLMWMIKMWKYDKKKIIVYIVSDTEK